VSISWIVIDEDVNCNSFPLHVCQSQTCSSFRCRLKTYYCHFHSAYPAP